MQSSCTNASRLGVWLCSHIVSIPGSALHTCWSHLCTWEVWRIWDEIPVYNFSNSYTTCHLWPCRLWENSKYVAKQLDKIGKEKLMQPSKLLYMLSLPPWPWPWLSPFLSWGLTLSTTLVNAGLTTFDKLQETNPRELELVWTTVSPLAHIQCHNRLFMLLCRLWTDIHPLETRSLP